jgi:hypothetical protein
MYYHGRRFIQMLCDKLHEGAELINFKINVQYMCAASAPHT